MATLEVQKFPQEGDLKHTYHALRNVLDENNKIVEFNTKEIEVDLNNPLTLDIWDDIFPYEYYNKFGKLLILCVPKTRFSQLYLFNISSTTTSS